MLDSMGSDAKQDGHHSAADAADQPIFTPSPETIDASQLTAFTRFLEARQGRRFDDQQALHGYSVEQDRAFWGTFLDWSGLPVSGDPEPVRTTDLCETAAFWPNLHLNYAEALLAGSDDDLAVLSVAVDGATVELTRGMLRERVLRMAGGLRDLGLRVGDPVLAILRNDAEAVIAALAVATLGGMLSTAAADSGVELLADRMADFAPRFLLTALKPLAHDAGAPLAERVVALAARLPSLEAVVALDDGAVGALPVALHCRVTGEPAAFAHHPFNQPLFVLFSSGTTGRPKGFLHGAGGTLVEHVKEHRLHGDLRPGDRLFFQTSPAWMMWHWQLSALATGAAIVLREGPVDAPETLWSLAADQGVTVFGTSPPYLRLCETLDYRPADALDLRRLRAVLSTGSILQPGQAHWIRSAVGPMPVLSLSGGSDIIGCFVLGSPNLPTFAGEAQCLGLGLDVRRAETGELICAAPFPSRPLGLLGDADGARFHETYFSRHKQAWAHGDLVDITPRGGAVLHGRMDGVLNVRGIRIGPAEIYGVLAELPKIVQAVAVEQGLGAGDARMVLLVVMAPGVSLDEGLKADIRRRLIERASPAHAPELILAVEALPTTHNGKLSETAATAAVNGRTPGNLAALRNPEALEAIGKALLSLAPAAPSTSQGGHGWLTAIWAEVLRRDSVGEDDDFFALGGNSLAAARVLAEIRKRSGHSLPMASLLRAPTVRALAALVDDPAAHLSRRLVQLRAGKGEPFFLVHSMTGNVLQLHGLIRALRTSRPIFGLQAMGLEAGESPLMSVEAMAEAYVDAIREVQPRGPYHLGGFSFGGLVAYEMARRLEAEGEVAGRLILLDSHMDKRFLPAGERMRLLAARLAHHACRIVKRPHQAGGYIRDRLLALAGRGRPNPQSPPVSDMPPHIAAVRAGIVTATARYAPGPYGGRVVFVKPRTPPPLGYHPDRLWKRLARGGIERVWTPGDHDSMIEPPHVADLAARLDERLA